MGIVDYVQIGQRLLQTRRVQLGGSAGTAHLFRQSDDLFPGQLFPLRAIASISTRASMGNLATSTTDLAG